MASPSEGYIANHCYTSPGLTDLFCDGLGPHMRDILYQTLSLRYRQSNWEAIASVRNVLDTAPPYLADGHTTTVTRFINTLPGAGYDLLGRSYILQLSYQL